VSAIGLLAVTTIVKFKVRTGPVIARQLRVDQIVKTGDFVEVSESVTAWVEGQFGRLERRLEWLSRYGDYVLHYCDVFRGSPGFSISTILRPSPHRNEARIYGFDGSLDARLTQLRITLAGLGWPRFQGRRLGGPAPEPKDWTESPFGHPPPVGAPWRPEEGARTPAGNQAAADTEGQVRVPGHIWIDVGWLSAGEPFAVPIDTRMPGAPDEASRCYQIIDHHPADLADLTRAALAEHEHALIIQIMVWYRVELEQRLARYRAHPARQARQAHPAAS
jgi:hypothetical protein